MELEFDLIPETSFGSNLRLSKPALWNKLRKVCYERADHKCEICGSTDSVLEAHEIFSYDEINHIQKLKDMIALCKDCHMVKHIGRTEWLFTEKIPNPKELNRIIQHFLDVNKVTKAVYDSHHRDSFRIWRERSNHDWTLDFSLFDKEVSL